jgi:glycine dehydrogenase
MNSFNAHYFKPFEERHNGPSTEEQLAMLQRIGVNSLDELIDQTVPANIRMKTALQTGEPMSEAQFLNRLKDIAAKNKTYKQFIGMGYYNTITPNVILRNIMENPGWYTQYTPYQAEIAQGRLEALLNFQTMIIDLTGMEIANASLLDEGTAAAEAMAMFKGLLPRKSEAYKFFVDQEVFPQTLDLLFTRAEPMGIEIVVGNYKEFTPTAEFFGAFVQYPNDKGEICDYRDFVTACKAAEVKTCFGADLMSLTLLTPPGEFGADCVVGNSQRFGVPLGFGGPHAAFFATKDEYKRQVPGRIIGVSLDRREQRALRMALQTREQHIKRQNATSNICTAQVLLSIMASMYAVYHGPDGLKRIAGRIHGQTRSLKQGLEQLGYHVMSQHYFDTLYLDAAGKAPQIRTLAENAGMNFRYFENGNIGISLNEASTEEDLNDILGVFAQSVQKSHIQAHLETSFSLSWEAWSQRSSNFMTHPVFNSYHIEHEMLRYIKRLESKDLSLCHSMIPLGSCTMKLNATTEMIPVTWPEFNALHPFAPVDQAAGYLEIINELDKDLSEITGFAKMSMQPNSGAQGEYAGLMVIREYFKDRGESHRNVALIPSSAHGTNPASAVMAGMEVVVTACDERGNIDVEDLRLKAEQYKDRLAVLMVTYPSTHGVFESAIQEITQIIHDFGGQVYMDGANMNAQVGLTSPGLIGADVCHLNLHKTFCIPHGGGGPGMGPIGVAAHLAPYLPNHVVTSTSGEKGMRSVSAAPWGSASILLISYAYIKMMGGAGLTQATKVAILNANYMKARLEKEYPILYTGENGRAAHEMILDTRGFKQSAHVEAEDIAKRLMDYGFHAPTLSFPVAGTLMLEPTESESKEELDRYCDALLSIREEIREIEQGIYNQESNVLKNAPHTMEEIAADHWPFEYGREKAAYPLASLRLSKFWPSVSRVNNTYGDRNLVCSCLPIEAYQTSQA